MLRKRQLSSHALVAVIDNAPIFQRPDPVGKIKNTIVVSHHQGRRPAAADEFLQNSDNGKA